MVVSSFIVDLGVFIPRPWGQSWGHNVGLNYLHILFEKTQVFNWQIVHLKFVQPTTTRGLGGAVIGVWKLFFIWEISGILKN